MKHREYLGDDRLRHRIVYEANESLCIYCGEIATSREHIPSKVFLEEPFPDNLYLVPACSKCNNSFSQDELYTWFIIKILEQYSGKCLNENLKKRSISHPDIYGKAKKDISDFADMFSDDSALMFEFKSKRIERILEKLAIGHAVYELSEGYFSGGSEGWQALMIKYAFAPALSQEVMDDFNAINIVNDLLWPEIGSRIYENFYAITFSLNEVNGDNSTSLGGCFFDWVEIQSGVYRYITNFASDEIQVKIVIDEFLFAEVVYRRHAD
jgi:hypothetical protein